MVLRSILILAGIWLVMLFTGYGVLTGSQSIAMGLGLRCEYLTAKGVTVSRYLHSRGGITGVTECPWFSKRDNLLFGSDYLPERNDRRKSAVTGLYLR